MGIKTWHASSSVEIRPMETWKKMVHARDHVTRLILWKRDNRYMFLTDLLVMLLFKKLFPDGNYIILLSNIKIKSKFKANKRRTLDGLSKVMAA